jgi:DNA-binding beta-propeller fold protein YncE
MAERTNTESRTIILGPYEDVRRDLGGDSRDYTWPVAPNPPIRTGRTKVFPGRATLGPADPDADDTLTTLNFMDVSGGAGVYTIKPASDLNHYWWGVASAEGTDGMTAAREAIMRQPSAYTGNCVPVGRIGVSTYVLWGSDLHLWNPDAQTFGTTAGDVGTVVNTEGIATFNGRMFFPLGSSGYSYTSESAPGTLTAPTTVAGAATPAYSATPGTSNPRVWAFAVWKDMLWALTTAAEGYALVPSLTGDTGDWDWVLTADTARETIIKIESSFEPKTMAVFPNAQNQQSLWVAGRRGLKVFNDTDMRWDDSALTDVPPHPDFGRAMKVFRPGEALKIAGGGGDVVTYTVGGAVVPADGPGGGRDGMPANRRGALISFATDLAHLYGLVKGEAASVATNPLSYAAKFGAAGSGDGQFGNDAKQIARAADGKLYVADFGNDRVQEFTAAGLHLSNVVTGVDEVTGICFDDEFDLYVSYKHGANDYRVRKYDLTGAVQWTSITALTAYGHLATDGTHVYATFPATGVVTKFLASDGSLVTSFGSGMSSTYGIAYCAATGLLYVTDQGNDRVRMYTTAGVFVDQFGSSGTADDQFTLPTGIAVSSTGDKIWVADGTLDRVQLFDGDGDFLAKFGATGTGDGQFDTPDGIAVIAADTSAWVVDSLNDRVQRVADSGGPYPGIGVTSVLANTGKGWHPAWEGVGVVGTPTKIVVSDMARADGSTDYRAFWGVGEECWSFACRLTTHSSRQAIQTGTGERFATASYLEWGPFHGGSIAIHKLASHAALLMEHATTTDYVAYQYMTDHQHEEAWITLGTATTDASDDEPRVVLPFGLTADALFSEGLNFHWIRQRLLWVTASPLTPAIVTSLTLAYLPITQDAATKAYTVVLPVDRDAITGKTADQIVNGLEALLSPTLGDERFLYLMDGQREYRAYISSISYGHAPTADGPGALTLSVIQIPTGVSTLVGES